MAQITVRDQETGRSIIVNLPGSRKVPTPQELAAIKDEIAAKPEPMAAGAGPSQGEAAADVSGMMQAANSFRSVRGLDPAIRFAGGTLGMLAGGGPTPTGLMGGALGAAGASALIDPLVALGRRTGVVGPEGPIIDDPQAPGGRGGVLGIASRAASEGAIDLALPAAAASLGRGARRGFQRIAATGGDASRRVQMYAQDLGIPLGIENVSERGFLRKARETIGRFPFFSKPFRELDVKQGEGLVRAQEEMLHAVSPIASTVTETGADLSRRVVARTKGMRSLFNQRYETLLDDATAEGALIPTTTVKQVARDIVDVFSGELPQKKVMLLPGVRTEVPIDPSKTGLDTSVVDFARSELSNLSDTMTPRQFKRMQTILNDLIAANSDSNTNAGRAIALRKALEEDFENIVGSETLVASLRETNASFREWMRLLQSPTAQRFQRAERGAFSVASMRPGSTNPDELFKVVFNQRSPQAVSDLAKLVGPNGMRRALRLHIEETFKSTFDETTKIADLGKARSALGIGKPRSAERQAFSRALELSRTGQTIEQWERFFDVAGNALEQAPINVSQFIARRATLGGVRALARGLNPASILAPTASAGAGAFTGSLLGSTPSGLAIGLAAAFGARRGLKTLADPRALKAATDAIDPAVSISARNQALLRFTRLVGREEMREIETAFNQAVEDFAERRSESKERKQ